MPPNRDRLLNAFLELVKIPSPSRREAAVADYIRGAIASPDCTIEEDETGGQIGGECGNLIVRIPARGEGPKLLLAAHMDTIESGEQPIAPIVDGDNINSEGDTILGADDKTGVACLLELLHRLEEDQVPHGELRVLFTVAEEKELLGVLAMESGVYDDLDAGIVLDHSIPEEIIIGAPTKLAVRITVQGVGGHAAFPERRINAAHVLAQAMGRLPSKRLDEFTTCNLGIINSGTAINVIPDLAYAEWEIRSHKEDLLDFHLARALTTIEAAVREARVYVPTDAESGLGGDPGGDDEGVRKATVEVEVVTCYERYRLDEEALPVQLLRRGIEAAGKHPRTVIAQGGSDSNVLNRHGLPTAVIGCGMHGAHSPRERASIEEMCDCVEVLLGAVRG